MEEISLPAILSLAFGLGLVHALDADHIAAVCGLAGTKPGRRESFSFCARWAVGHGMTILALGSVAVFLGPALPESLSKAAENLVGPVLIVIGLWVIVDLKRRRAHLHFHRHDDLPNHAHWHVHGKHEKHDKAGSHRHGHGAVMVGMLHGAAGLAPLLALVPLSNHTASSWEVLACLAVFGLGVLGTMLVFGGLVGLVFDRAMRRGETLVTFLRGGVGCLSMGLGVYLLTGAI
ncbi:MAG: sulfite exporter TauE/SafE family protein [Nitrospinales bacterium]